MLGPLLVGVGVGTAAVLDTLISGLLYSFEARSKSAQPAGHGWGGAYPPTSPRGGIPPGPGYLHRTLNEGGGSPSGPVGMSVPWARMAFRAAAPEGCGHRVWMRASFFCAGLAKCACAVPRDSSHPVITPHAHAWPALWALLVQGAPDLSSSQQEWTPGVHCSLARLHVSPA